MWTIYTNKWGVLQASDVHPSVTFPGTVSVHEATRGSQTLWLHAYVAMHEIETIIPPDGR